MNELQVSSRVPIVIEYWTFQHNFTQLPTRRIDVMKQSLAHWLYWEGKMRMGGTNGRERLMTVGLLDSLCQS